MASGTAQRRELRRRVAGEQNWRCCYCGSVMVEQQGQRDSVTLERVIPGAQGGRYEYGNVVAACWGCNNDRGDGRRAKRPGKPGPTAQPHPGEPSVRHVGRWPSEARATLGDVWPTEQARRAS